jgi:regulatory LuxR family protein/PAS domain-containing protein
MATADQNSLDLTATLGHLGLPSVVVSREGRISWMNDAARALFGDLVGQISLGTTVVPEHAPLARREFERKLDGAPYTDYDQLLAQGKSTEQIAAELHLTTETVRNHVRHVLKALDAHSRLEAVVVARRQGLIRDI